MKKTITKIGKMLKHPKFMLVMGSAILLAGVIEVFEIATMEFFGFDIGAEHVILLFGFNQMVIALSHMVEGIENISMVEEEMLLQKEEIILKKEITTSATIEDERKNSA